MRGGPARAETEQGAFNFKEVEAGVDGTHHVADGYEANILIRWGDKVLAGAAAFFAGAAAFTTGLAFLAGAAFFAAGAAFFAVAISILSIKSC